MESTATVVSMFGFNYGFDIFRHATSLRSVGETIFGAPGQQLKMLRFVSNVCVGFPLIESQHITEV